MKTIDLTLFREDEMKRRLFLARFGNEENRKAMKDELDLLIKEAIESYHAQFESASMQSVIERVEGLKFKPVTNPELKQFPGKIQFYNDALDDVLKILRQSRLKHEQGKWKKYPDNRPEKNKPYWVRMSTGQEMVATSNAFYLFFGMDWPYNYSVIAFRELPKPYEP